MEFIMMLDKSSNERVIIIATSIYEIIVSTTHTAKIIQ